MGIYRERGRGRRLAGGEEKMRGTKRPHLSRSKFIPLRNMAFACATTALGLLKMWELPTSSERGTGQEAVLESLHKGPFKPCYSIVYKT